MPTYLDPQLQTATWFLIGNLVATRQTVAARLWKIVSLYWSARLCVQSCWIRIWLDDMPPDNPCFRADFRREASCVGRWMAPTEALAAQAFPVHPVQLSGVTTCGLRTCCFHFPRSDRKGRAIAGNSMNVICPYICHLHSAAAWKPQSESNRTEAVRCALSC